MTFALLTALPLGGRGSEKKERGLKMLNLRDLVVEISRLGRVFGMARYSEVVAAFGIYQLGIYFLDRQT